MEKKEARIKCSGCNTSYKLKIPVTDKPVSFKCKKCGKVLKIKLKAAEAAAVEQPRSETSAEEYSFQMTQLPDSNNYQDTPAPPRPAAPEQAPSRNTDLETEDFEFVQKPGEADYQEERPEEKTRRWIVLDGDAVKGPFADDEIITMIKGGSVEAETSMRMGERPWIKAFEIATFKKYFVSKAKPVKTRPGKTIEMDQEPSQSETRTPFYAELPKVLTYPTGNTVSLGIFAGIAFVLTTILAFSFRESVSGIDFIIGLLINIIGWIVLYGYLSQVAHASRNESSSPPPEWNFGQISEMFVSGAKIFAGLFVLSLLPVAILLLVMVAFFLGNDALIGWIALILTILLFAGSMFLVPGSLVILEQTGNIGAALNPANAIAFLQKSGRPYLMLSAVSVAMGFAGMLAVLASVFVTDIDFGFIIAGLLMGLVLTYGHFVWFHVIGRYTGENAGTIQAVVAPPAKA
jgi:hypothetical protein